MSPVVYCACPCHARQLNGRVEVNDASGALSACARCMANHNTVIRYVKDPDFRRLPFDVSEPLDFPRPADATGTSEDLPDEKDGERGG